MVSFDRYLLEFWALRCNKQVFINFCLSEWVQKWKYYVTFLTMVNCYLYIISN
ncbi:hypothetical protein SVI_0349 [Shewanella violacea DSS12]|uniref:Uncharacterized protein n=1 Tax=Shewanella violacea (strain JCM 10179 / CIP 106290 / LMG 19151 / DSS12) TaxID=637905 RepID=D4ZEU0_SHEVD|nr:hypothetical protein SVI_0349 [Shewanella violacea DSS12]